jgi:phage terminase small subunit
MKKLTAKQEAFCQGIADGKTQADAYRAAYDAENMTDKSVWEKASELMATVKVSSRVAELKQNLEEKQLWTRMDSVNGLVAIFRNSKDERPAVAINAIKELNNMHGFNAPIKLDQASSDGSIGGAVALTNEQLAEELKKRNLPTGFLDE